MYRPHALLRFGGRWFATEEWSCGLRVMTDDNSATVQQWIDTLEPNEPGGIPTVLEAIKDLVEDWFLRAGTGIPNQARLDYVAMNAILPDGKYADPGNPHIFEYPAGEAPTGPLQAAALPQVTVCLSLRTATQRGTATKGRIYPPTAIQATADGRVGSSTAQGMGDSAAVLLEGISEVDSPFLAGGLRVGVVSNISGPNGDTSGLGPSRIVTRVLVGNVFDTQRRRRNQLVETYTTSTVDT